MENNSIHQEILLVTSNTFSQRQFCEIDTPANSRPLSFNQKIEEACWNGMLSEMLPEVLEKTKEGKALFLWHVRQGKSFLQLELSEFPVKVDKAHSIDTTFFLAEVNYN